MKDKTAILYNKYFQTFAIALLFFGLFACKQSKSTTTQTKTKSLNFEKIEDGTQCGIKTDTLMLIRNINDLNTNWKKLKSNMGGAVKIPVVDFSKHNIIIVAQGMKNSGGYSVDIKSVNVTANNVIVNADFNKPGKNCIVTDVITYPYEVIKIPKVNKMVLLNKKEITNDCK